MNATQTLARYALKLRYRDIPSEVIERAKACILDTLAVSLYGSTKQGVIARMKQGRATTASRVDGLAVETSLILSRRV
jgi:2-methylcitrate dehydratase PrpD